MLGLWTERRAYLDAAGHVERCLSCLDFGVDMFRDFLFTCGVKKGVRWKWTASAIRERINGKKEEREREPMCMVSVCARTYLLLQRAWSCRSFSLIARW